jgi:hypothetical protein
VHPALDQGVELDVLCGGQFAIGAFRIGQAVVTLAGFELPETIVLPAHRGLDGQAFRR